MFSRRYIFLFAATVTIICSVALSMTSAMLKPLQEKNLTVDITRNILLALGFEKDRLVDSDRILAVYDAEVEEIVITRDGRRFPNHPPARTISVEEEQKKPKDEQRLPLYVRNQDGRPVAYCLPVFGKGLWSTMYGYFALLADLDTVSGINFYKHGETPGLGAEIEAVWFGENFHGKRIFNASGDLVGIEVVKGKVADLYGEGEAARHAVDGISGATITSKGVGDLLLKDLTKYLPFILAEKERTGRANEASNDASDWEGGKR